MISALARATKRSLSAVRTAVSGSKQLFDFADLVEFSRGQLLRTRLARAILSHAPTDNPWSSGRWVCSTISRIRARSVSPPYCTVTKPGPCKSAEVSRIAPGDVT
jgi:hypothetical protein